VTLERSISNASKDKLLDFLMRQGAVVKQVFDYRVRHLACACQYPPDRGWLTSRSSLSRFLCLALTSVPHLARLATPFFFVQFRTPHAKQVFKGVLFTVPGASDRGLQSWQTALLREEGVKIVEEDTIVKTS
jgi:hypothetical protein